VLLDPMKFLLAVAIVVAFPLLYFSFFPVNYTVSTARHSAKCILTRCGSMAD
jgi:hypothetical protein